MSSLACQNVTKIVIVHCLAGMNPMHFPFGKGYLALNLSTQQHMQQQPCYLSLDVHIDITHTVDKLHDKSFLYFLHEQQQAHPLCTS